MYSMHNKTMEFEIKMSENEQMKTYKRFSAGNVFWIVLILLLALAIFSYTPSDMSVLDGGSVEPVRNLIGPSGAYVSGMLFLLFGLAVYPMLLITAFSFVRRFIPQPIQHKGYFGAYLMFLIGLTIWFGLYPEMSDGISLLLDSMGLGRYHTDASANALPGGAVGQLLAAPEIPGEVAAGVIRRFIGEIGTLVIALALLLPALIVMVYEDWWDVLKSLGKGSAETAKASSHAAVPAAPVAVQPLPPKTVKQVTSASVENQDQPPFKPDAVPAEHSDNMTGPSFLSKMMGGLIGVKSDEVKQQAPPSHIPATSIPAINDPDDDYVVLPPRPLGSSEPVGDESVGGEPAVSSNLPPAPPEPAVQPIVPETLPTPAQREKTQRVQTVPDPVETMERVTPVNTPVGVQPAIQQFSDNRDKVARPPVPVNKAICDNYVLPPVKMLDQHDEAHSEDTAYLEESRNRLQQTLDSFSVAGHVENIVVGPRVTRYEVVLDDGVETSKITRIQSNIAMKMEAESVRILAPIPGRNAVGVEVPNKISSTVYIRAVMESDAWVNSSANIPIVLGRNVEGKAIVTNLAKAPHLLIAGSTGSGKSVCMNTLIMSLLFKFSPDDLRLILVDPKVVEMESYAKIPHLITPVVNDPKKVPLALRWGVNEMERRYRMMAKVHAKDFKTFNSRPKDPEPVFDEDGAVIGYRMPYLIIIIDELADIMMTEAKKDVETSICRIAQKGRAAGVHLVIATQTPRKDIITGIIKANLPVKIAFKVGTNMDSRVILDQGGAEKLLGMGDLLFNPPGASNLERIQMTLVTDDEIHRIVDFVSCQAEQHFNADVLAEDVDIKQGEGDGGSGHTGDDADDDMNIDEPSPEFLNSVAAKYLQPGDSDLLRQALELIINERQASTSFFQRRLGIGYNKSAELVDELERRNIISKPLGGGQKRDILILDGLEIADH